MDIMIQLPNDDKELITFLQSRHTTISSQHTHLGAIVTKHVHYSLFTSVLSDALCSLSSSHAPICRLEDSNSGPLSELSKWQRRLTLISSVVEQLKSKESKTVLAALVAAKSRLLKKWKNIDMQ